MAKTVNGVTTKYLVEDDVNPTGYPQVLDELTGSSVTRTYTSSLQRISEDQIVNSAWTPSFYSYDGGSNVRQLTNSAGAVTDTYEYDAFGNDVNHTGSTPNNYLYRGEQYDSDLGLYYLSARYYNPATGRFLSRDPEDGIPADPKTLHKYIYAGGDPVNLADPSGRAPGQTAVAGGAAGEWGGTVITLLQAASGVVATGIAIDCAYQFLSSETNAFVAIGLAGNGDTGTITRTGPCSVKPKIPKCDRGEDNHHMLPQQFSSWFAECGFPDIDAPQFLRCVPRNCHTGSGGLHSNQNGSGTSWNGRWAQFISEQNSVCPSMQTTINFMDQLEQEFAQQFICAGEE